jgi:hypothetical protein
MAVVLLAPFGPGRSETSPGLISTVIPRRMARFLGLLCESSTCMPADLSSFGMKASMTSDEDTPCAIGIRVGTDISAGSLAPNLFIVGESVLLRYKYGCAISTGGQ